MYLNLIFFSFYVFFCIFIFYFKFSEPTHQPIVGWAGLCKIWLTKKVSRIRWVAFFSQPVVSKPYLGESGGLTLTAQQWWMEVIERSSLYRGSHHVIKSIMYPRKDCSCSHAISIRESNSNSWKLLAITNLCFERDDKK